VRTGTEANKGEGETVTEIDRDSRDLFDVCKRIQALVKEAGAWGFRLEVVADGRVRADLFDSSGYSMIRGEATGDVHPEVSTGLDLAAMKLRAEQRKAEKK
jgi:hypothetical protein